MWNLTSADEIEQAAKNNELAESEIFDAKRELPAKGKNKDIAKDVAAMANDGGVILYGIDEDANGHPTVPSPIDLAGARERIANVVDTSISEPLAFTTKAYPLATNAARGYVVVIVPPSPRAPHMVVADKEYRYHRRVDTSSVPMSEGEVSRLYERRQRWAVDRDALLDRIIAEAPPALAAPDPLYAFLYVMARPTLTDHTLLSKVVPPNDPQRTAALNRLVSASHQIFRPAGSDLVSPLSLSRRGTGIRIGASLPYGSSAPSPGFIDLEIQDDGTARFLSRSVGATHGGRFALFENDIARYVTRALSIVGDLYRDAGYIGSVDVGVAVLGLAGKEVYSGAYASNFASTHPPVPFTSEYRETARVLARELASVPIRVARALVDRLIQALAPGLDPFPQQNATP